MQLVGKIGRHFEALPGGILVVRIPNQGLHLDEIDHPFEIIFRADRNLHRQRTRTEALFDHVDTAHEIGAAAIHLIDIAKAGHAVVVGETPIGFRLRLDSGHAVEYHDRAVEHAQGSIDLDREIDMSRSVDEIDFLVAPEG